MYLDTDCILALAKESDWLKGRVESRLRGERALCTSALTIVECRLVLAREKGKHTIHDIGSLTNKRRIKILPMDESVLSLSNELQMKYGFIGIFDSVHAATAMIKGQTILSTDHIFPLIEEIDSEDPRGESLGPGA